MKRIETKKKLRVAIEQIRVLDLVEVSGGVACTESNSTCSSKPTLVSDIR